MKENCKNRLIIIFKQRKKKTTLTVKIPIFTDNSKNNLQETFEQTFEQQR